MKREKKNFTKRLSLVLFVIGILSGIGSIYLLFMPVFLFYLFLGNQIQWMILSLTDSEFLPFILLPLFMGLVGALYGYIIGIICTKLIRGKK